MRPVAGGNAPEAPIHKQNNSELEMVLPSVSNSGPPTTFFMASESELDSRGSTCSSSYGIRSMDEAAERVTPAEDEGGANVVEMAASSRRRSTMKATRPGRSTEKIVTDQPRGSTGSSPAEEARCSFPSDSMSQPLTPISFASPMLGSSMPNSPKSMSPRHSDDGCSQAVSSCSGEEDEVQPGLATYTGAAPQLIMPSITMPSRRPFTKRGNELGRLKVLLAGSSGSGKTSLIKSIVQVCEDIVHVDSLSASTFTLKNEARSRSGSRPKSRRFSPHSNSTKTISEIYASTKAYPSWWAELENSDFLRRRRSTGDSVLERNLCFVDTPGCAGEKSALETMEHTLQYIEGQLSKSLSLSNLEDSEILSILSANGGFQVDVVLYLIVHELKPSDIEYIRRLSQLTSVIPLLAKADAIAGNDKDRLKAAVQEQLTAANIKPISFPINKSDMTHPFTICSSLSQDLEDMDASLLMQSDYIQPLYPSDLSHLLDLLLEKENFSYLKHSAAKKLLTWRKSSRTWSASSSLSINPPSQRNVTSGNSWQNPLQAATTDLNTRTPTALTYASARLADYTQREERLAQLRLASWAGSLQRSLQNERARYEALARGERLTWLRARLDECTLDGETVHFVSAQQQNQQQRLQPVHGDVGSSRSDSASALGIEKTAFATLKSHMIPTVPRLDPADPLGLLRWGDDMRQHGLRVLQIAGGVGLLGAAAIWVVRGRGDGSGSWIWSWWGWADGEGWGFLGRWIGRLAGWQ